MPLLQFLTLKIIHKKIFLSLPSSLAFLILLLWTNPTWARAAFGAPGATPTWSSARKMQVGTFLEEGERPKSPVWFTSSQGILTEVYYPQIDEAQIRDSQFLVSNGKDFFLEERKGTQQKVNVLSPSLVQFINSDPGGRFAIEHVFYTLKDSSTLVDQVTLRVEEDGLSFYLLTNSHLKNTGYKDNAFASADGLLFREKNIELRVAPSVGFRQASVGYVGQSDGYQDLAKDKKMDFRFTEAPYGNVAGIGEINIPPSKGVYQFYVVYHFSQTGDASSPNRDFLSILKKDLQLEKEVYQQTWDQHLSKLQAPADLDREDRLLYQRSLYVLKVHEDKSHRGAIVASLSIPWGEERRESPNHLEGGYHLVWPRDLFHSALSLLLAGDRQTPWRSLRFLQKIQYKEADGYWNYSQFRTIKKLGAFPQNTWVDGRPYWQGLQLDQVGFPVHLFYQLYQRSPAKDQEMLKREFSTMLRLALNFIKNYGPWSAQERWEENFGISPSTFSVAASALLLGEKIFPEMAEAKDWGNTARDWLYKPGDNIDTWTYTTNGVYGDGKYYIRVSGCSYYDEVWDPHKESICSIANSGLRVPQQKILDQGFLQLALLGLRPAGDLKIESSLKKVNSHIRVKTPAGYGWYRYSFDAYGEEGRGRLWPILTGEHARYLIEKSYQQRVSWEKAQTEVEGHLQTMRNFSNEGFLIPEQVWENSGEGTGAATPLAWSHAEYLKLLWSYHLRKNVENPFIPYEVEEGALETP